MSAECIYFDSLTKVPSHLAPPHHEVVKFVSGHVEHASKGKTYNCPHLFDTLQSNPGEGIALDLFKNTSIAKSQMSVNVLANRIAGCISTSFNSASDMEDLAATLETTLTNLKSASSNGFADWIKPANPKHSYWELRLVVSFPKEDLLDQFFSLVMTLHITADMIQYIEWFALQPNTTHTFSATVDVMRLVVSNEFQCPN